VIPTGIGVLHGHWFDLGELLQRVRVSSFIFSILLTENSIDEP